jgi:hypothetical protein
MPPGTAEENQQHHGRQAESQSQKKDGRHIPQGMFDQHKGGAPDEGIDDQRGFGAPLDPQGAALHCEATVK